MELPQEQSGEQTEQIRWFGNNIRGALAEVRHQREILRQHGLRYMFRNMLREAAMAHSGGVTHMEREVEPGWRSSQFVDGTGRVTAIRDSDGNIHPLAHPEVIESLLDQKPNN